jgi:hypothetical protein
MIHTNGEQLTNLPCLLALTSCFNTSGDAVGSIFDAISKRSQSITNRLSSTSSDSSHSTANLRGLSALMFIIIMSCKTHFL